MEAAKALKVAASLLSGASPDDEPERVRHAIRKIQEAARAAPQSPFVRMKLMGACLRLAGAGEPEFLRLAQGACDEALRLAPADRDVHLARLELVARRGDFDAARREYEARRDELPFAGELLTMLGALEAVVASRREAASAGGTAGPRRSWRLPAAVGAGVVGLLALLQVFRQAVQEEDNAYMGSSNFFVAIGFLTAAAVLLRAWVQERKGGAP